MELTDTERDVAKKIVDEMVWQPAEGHNYRYEHAMRTLTRYCECASMEPDVFRLVIEYLRTQELGDGRISLLNKQQDLGGGWKAMDAWYQTSPSEKFEGTQSTKVRVYQILMLANGNEAGDGPYAVENGCQYKVSHTFFWDVEQMPTVPQGESGVQYSMQGVTRDKQTGLFSCVLERRERVQQDIPIYESEETIFEKTRRESHIGVKQGSVGSTGRQASAGGGVLVERLVRKNPDCTSDVENVERTEQPVTAAVEKIEKTWEGVIRTRKDRNQPARSTAVPQKPGSSVTNEKTPGGLYDVTTVQADETPLGTKGRDCRKTIFEHSDTVVKNQPEDPGEQHGSAGDGKIVEKSSQMTRFGTWDVTERTIEEDPVSSSVVQYRKTLQGTVEQRTDRNQQQPLNGAGLKVGETRRSEKTPGGRYNNTEEKVTTEPGGDIGQDCEAQTLVHTDSSLSNDLEKPQDIERSPSVNKRKSRSARKTGVGTWDVQEQETTWEPTQKIKTWTDNDGVHTVCTYRNQVEPLVASGARVTVSFTQNDHGSYDGSYVIHPERGSGSGGGKLQWSDHGTINTRFIYAKAGGKMFEREVTATHWLCFGATKHVMNEIKNAEEFPLAGLVTKFSSSNDEWATADWYENIEIGPERAIQ